MRSTMAIALMSSVVAAQNGVTTTLFIPGFDQQALVASIIGGDASATTYSIGCPPDTDVDDCGAAEGFTLIEGPKTLSMEMVLGDSSTFFLDLGCELTTSISEAVCVETAGGSEANFPGVVTSTFAPDDYASAWIEVTITAGSVSGAPATTAASATAPTASVTSAVATGSSTTSTVTATAASTSGSESTTAATSSGGLSTAAGDSASASSSKSSATEKPASASASSSVVSTGGMPQITGNAQWAVGGAAAIAMALAAI